jgi:transcriptional regulator with XRE-family HTH domain
MQNVGLEKLSNRLKRLREKKGLSVKDVAKAIGVPVSTYREWEYGRTIRGEPYVNLSILFEVSLYELMTGVPSSNAFHMESSFEKLNQIENLVREIRIDLKKRE